MLDVISREKLNVLVLTETKVALMNFPQFDTVGVRYKLFSLTVKKILLNVMQQLSSTQSI